jgi:hypothetical protein
MGRMKNLFRSGAWIYVVGIVIVLFAASTGIRLLLAG